LINLENIRGRSAISLLQKYEGKNPYIKRFKHTYETYKKINLTEGQIKYIVDNHDREPMFINKVVEITEWLGKELQTQENLKFVPKKIQILYILADAEKTYHIYGKVKQNQEKPKMYFIPKTQVLEDPYFNQIDVDVDFDKYQKLDTFELKDGTIGRTPYQHQIDGVKFLLTRDGCILADIMGAGKSYQSIIAALESGAKKILIVCPSSLKINWEREIHYFQCFDTTIVSGRKWSEAKFTIINYDILKNFHALPSKDLKKEQILDRHQKLISANFDLCIIDEAHKLKNKDSNRGKIMSEVCAKIPKVWLLSGTPVANRPMDFYNLLKLIKSPLTKNWKFFAERYCEGRQITTTLKNKQKKRIWLTNGASNLDELNAKCRNTILRRLKSDIADMPEKNVIPMVYEMSDNQIKNYKNLWEEYLIERIEKNKKGTPEKELVELGLLRKFVAMEMIPETIKLVEEIIESGDKVIIFTNFTDEIKTLYNYFGKKSVIHYGEMSDNDKQISIDKFQKDNKIKVFIGNIISAGVGITLTESNYVIFNSFSWVPGDNEQGEDRCIFGGQNILTSEGYKKIEAIEVGDYVYTHKGNFKLVNDKHSHLERKKLRIDIDAFGCNQLLSTTDDHKIYIYDEEDSNFKWVKSGEINIKTQKLTFPINECPKKPKKYIKLVNYTNSNFKNQFDVTQNNGRLKILKEKVYLSNDLLYAFGFYVADGYSSVDGGKGYIIGVGQKIDNKKMYDASEYIIKIFKESFNINKHSSYVDKNNTKTCTIHSKNLALNFKNWFGDNVYSKQFPEWVDELNEEQLSSLLDGYYHGDGYRRKNTQQAVTASKKLISQLIRYNANLNLPISFREINETEFTIEYTVNNNLKNRITKRGNFITYPIKKLIKSHPKRGYERVYDLTVEDDHSFVVGNYVVHNCHRIGQINNVTIYYQLFKDTISVNMWNVLNNKKSNIDKIVGDENVTPEYISYEIIKQNTSNE